MGPSFFQKPAWTRTQLDPVIYIVTKIPLYIVINPKSFYSSFHFSSRLCLSSLQLTISLILNLTADPTAQPLTVVPSSLTQCLTWPPLPLHLSALLLTWPQAHKQSSTGITLYSLNSISSLSSPISHCRTALCPSNLPHPRSHSLACSTSFSTFFLFSFFPSSVHLNHVSLCLCLCLWFWKEKS